jgi:hypothetical protein
VWVALVALLPTLSFSSLQPATILLHPNTTQAIFYLKLGRFVGLHVKTAPGAAPQDSPNLLPLLDTLVAELAAAVAATEQQEGQQQQQEGACGGMEYVWLPLVVIKALVALLWAHVHKARGEVPDAKQQLEAGEGSDGWPRLPRCKYCRSCCSGSSYGLQFGVKAAGACALGMAPCMHRGHQMASAWHRSVPHIQCSCCCCCCCC